MDNAPENIWNHCLEYIKENLSIQSYETWFEPIKAVKIEGTTLTIQVPSPFFYEWLEEYYLDILKKAISKALGTEGRLEYSIVVDKEKVDHHLTKSNVNKPFIKTENNVNTFKSEQPIFHPEGNLDLANIEANKKVSQLVSSLRFDNFIEGKFNRLSRSAGLAIAQSPGTTSFNPFFVYSEVGLGKTHLIQAIGNEINRLYTDKFVLYITAEQFANQFIEAIQKKRIQQFTNYYLQVDVFLIDDIQFLCKKEKTQENFFHIFNFLHQNGKQIIMTSDQAPKDLQGVQERLLSRFKWGLTTDIQSPGPESRKAIIQSKIEIEDMSIEEDVIEYLANNINSNIREMEGLLISMIARASLVKRDLDLNLAKDILQNILLNTSEKEVTIEYIQEIICQYFNISMETLNSKSRKREIAMARQIAMYLSHKNTDMSLKNIGQKFGGRDHTTVIHASRTIEARKADDAHYKKILDDLNNKIG